jgi:hypothetical protein
VILPIETDDALEALRLARDQLGVAVDALRDMSGPSELVATFMRAHDAAAWTVDTVTTAIARAPHAVTAARDEALEERHVEGQSMPWVDGEP